MNDHVKQCQPYWDEFAANRNELVFESEKILAEYQETTIEKKFKKELADIPKSLKGESRIVEVKARVNQHFFRELVLTNYDSKCALTGIDLTELLVASHIIPWADNEEERLNPANGICLSSLYDKAFDCGLISFQDDGQVIFSSRLEGNVGKDYYAKHFQIIKGRKLATPQKYNLNPAFLEWHRDIVFKH
jgi:putative restriction endonuclease